MRQDLKYLEKKINYQFSNLNLLTQAVTHRSYSDVNNERFEFLGDALLSLIIAEELYKKLTKAAEGDLTRVRSKLVNGDSLASVADYLEINKYILLGDGELKSGGLHRRSILADCVEAIIAAIYLDSDYVTCRKIILEWYNDRLSNLDSATISKDSKSILQEWLQSKQYNLPEYVVISQSKVEYDQIFVVQCLIKQLNIVTDGTAKNRRQAEQIAAAFAMDIIKKNSK